MNIWIPWNVAPEEEMRKEDILEESVYKELQSMMQRKQVGEV